jgi:hypothetical protein
MADKPKKSDKRQRGDFQLCPAPFEGLLSKESPFQRQSAKM